jgi:hypothetical protein
VRDVLEREIQEPSINQRGHLTPIGLFELIAGHADEVIVLDDLTAVLKSDVALQILLSALLGFERPRSQDPGAATSWAGCYLALCRYERGP